MFAMPRPGARRPWPSLSARRAGCSIERATPSRDATTACVRRRRYIAWIRRFILYHGKRHPLEVGREEVEAYLTYLARDQQVSASTQNQALCALVFLYREVLDRDLGWLEGFQRAKAPMRSPTILSQEEVGAVLAHLDGALLLMAELLYGAG
jgi:site-specific recombinase XerD